MGKSGEVFHFTRKLLVLAPTTEASPWSGQAEPQKAPPTPTRAPALGSGVPWGWILWVMPSASVFTGRVFLTHISSCNLLNCPPRPSGAKPHRGEIVSLFVLVD